MRKAQFVAAMQQQQQQADAAPRSEDFKARMKRELQQAARDAMAGKGQGKYKLNILAIYLLCLKCL